jgi:hydrogenase 3 maturation protease
MLASAPAPQTKASKLAVLGIGNELNGDDAAGVQIALRLLDKDRLDRSLSNSLILNTGLAPENFTGVLRRFAPDGVLFVDAADMGEPAGTVSVLDWRDSSGFGPSTHLQPIATLGEYLEVELGCRVMLLGIQPARLDFDTPLSPEVEGAVMEVVECLDQILVAEG